MKLPDGVVDLRKVKTVLGGEHTRPHLTWVIAYSAAIEPGSERYETIRAFGGALKPPRDTEQSVMFLPVAPPDVSQAPPPQPRPRAATQAKSRPKPRAKVRAKPRKKPRPKSAAQPRTKTPPRRARKPARPRAALRRTRGARR